MFRVIPSALGVAVLALVAAASSQQTAFAEPSPEQKTVTRYGVYIKERSQSDPWKLVGKYDTRAQAQQNLVLRMRHGGQAAVQIFEIQEPVNGSVFNPGKWAAKSIKDAKTSSAAVKAAAKAMPKADRISTAAKITQDKVLTKPFADRFKPGSGSAVTMPDRFKTKVDFGPKIDLAVTSFSGTRIGDNYVFSGTIQNVGTAANQEGRTVRIFVVSSQNRPALLAPVNVPSLQPGQSWKIPMLTIPAANVRTDIVPMQFILGLSSSDADGNFQNDWRQSTVK